MPPLSEPERAARLPLADSAPEQIEPRHKPVVEAEAQVGQSTTRLAGGLQALCTLARLHHLAAEPISLAHRLALPTDSVSISELLLAATTLGLKAKRVRSSADRLKHVPLPALALMRDGSAAILAQCDGERVLWQGFAGADGAPAMEASRPTINPVEGFVSLWSGELILVTSRASLAGELARFDFSWFIPSLVKHRRLLGEVLLISFFLQLLALVTPLFFQVVMDKVLVHRGLDTLNVLVAGLAIVVIFESLLGALRTYVFSHTTSRIDVELGSRLYRHLLALPMGYFQARRVGDTVARVRELEQIRAFLTGNAITLLLDVVFCLVFIAVMFAYSVKLTLLVLASIPLYVGISLAVMPVLRRRLDEKFARGAENQSLLVESITGIQTVKAAALEPQLGRRWDDQLAAYVSASFRALTLASFGQEGIQLVSKLVNAATLWFGARAVMDGELTVGMFVAFNMFAGRVSQPVLRLAQMWSDFQQTGLSMRRLADILNAPTELPAAHVPPLPRLQGHVQFEGVSFHYRPEAPPVLRGVDFRIQAGEVVGIVGRSGSGKSTLAKLVQRLHVPQQGRVRIDGIDLALADAAQLRRQIGVVLQDNFLFNRSVRENIAVADPAAPLERVIAVAKLAGAHDFITQLPEGYETRVGEQGAALSGGQRQRVAIARALFTDPRLLILDEATSALDYESEAVLQAHMGAICKGRTVVIVAHRLSALRHATRIIAMEQGQVVEEGSHAELLRRGGVYAHLWRLQGGTLATTGGGAP